MKPQKDKKPLKKIDEKFEASDTVSFRRYILYSLQNKGMMAVEENEDKTDPIKVNDNTEDSETLILNGLLENAARYFRTCITLIKLKFNNDVNLIENKYLIKLSKSGS